MKFTVRDATEADAAVLARFRYELRAMTHEIIENEAAFIERCTSWMRAQLRGEGNWKCWIAELESRPVGSVWAQLIEKIPNPIAEPEHYVYLTNFYVREEHRSRGVGSLLLLAVLEWSKSNDAELVLLTPTERSRPLYLRHGFSLTEKFMTLKLKH
jgi:GNAT superfamily N-acetyltransferase